LGLYTIKSPRYRDHRGSFHEIAVFDQLKKMAGIDFRVSQANISFNLQNVLRGLHAEHWDKIVYIATGIAFLALLDLRESSQTFGEHETFTINGDEDDAYAVLVPRGFANSFCVIKGPVNYIYFTNARYDGTDQTAVAYDSVGIKWPIKDPILSEKDSHNPTFRQLFPERHFSISA